MTLDRRHLFAALAGAATVAAPRAQARVEADSTLRPNAAEDQSKTLQRLIDRSAAIGAELHLPAGNYLAGGLQLPNNAAISGVRGATRLIMAGSPSMMSAIGSDHVSLSDLTFDGANIPLPDQRGLVHLRQGRAMHISNCEVTGAGRNGIALEMMEGDVTGNAVSAADNAIFSIDARGLRIAGNTVRGAGNGGIRIWRSASGDDGTLVVDNRIDNVANNSGGSGQYGNGVNVFRAGNVIVRGNRISNVAFSAVRGNEASNLQVLGNTCTNAGEAALFAEFGFEGAIIANNVIDHAALGIAVANFDRGGGRLAVVQGNLIRNITRLVTADPDDRSGTGIHIEADSVASGNVIENAARIGVSAGYGPYLRDVTINANVLRGGDYGIAVSVVPGAGTAVISANMIADVRIAAIVGMEWKKPVTGDLSKDGAGRYAQLAIDGNRVR